MNRILLAAQPGSATDRRPASPGAGAARLSRALQHASAASLPRPARRPVPYRSSLEAWSTSGLFTDGTDSAGSFTSTRSPHDDGIGFSAPQGSQPDRCLVDFTTSTKEQLEPDLLLPPYNQPVERCPHCGSQRPTVFVSQHGSIRIYECLDCRRRWSTTGLQRFRR